MALEIKEGRFYKDADGNKVGPIVEWGYEWKWTTDEACGDLAWRKDGTSNLTIRGNDLVSEWIESPIRTVTRRELVPGEYGIFTVMVDKHGALELGLNFTRPDANDLRSAAMVLSQLAEFLDEDKGDE